MMIALRTIKRTNVYHVRNDKTRPDLQHHQHYRRRRRRRRHSISFVSELWFRAGIISHSMIHRHDKHQYPYTILAIRAKAQAVTRTRIRTRTHTQLKSTRVSRSLHFIIVIYLALILAHNVIHSINKTQTGPKRKYTTVVHLGWRWRW